MKKRILKEREYEKKTAIYKLIYGANVVKMKEMYKIVIKTI